MQVREIFDLYLALGGLLPVVDELNRRDWRNKAWTTKKGYSKGDGAFDKGSLHALLTNPIYIGKIRHKKDLFDGIHEPIVEVDLFRQVQKQLQHNSRTGGVEVRNKHGALLKGLLFCKACNCSMTHTFTSKRSKRYRYYTCTHAIKSGRRNCPSRSLPALHTEETVVDQFRELVASPVLREEVLKQSLHVVSVEADAMKKEREQLKSQVCAHHADIHKLSVDEKGDEVTTAIAKLHDRIADADKRLTDLDKQIQECKKDQLTQEQVEAAFVNFDDFWETLSPREQASALRCVFERIEFDAVDSSLSMEFHSEVIQALAQDRQEEAA